MATLIATPGASNANSYATLVEGDAYADSRLYSDVWNDGDEDPGKVQALISATSWLDALFIWTGAAATSTQALAWPRTGMLSRNGFAIPSNEIPFDLKKATVEFAIWLMTEQRTADNEAEKQGISAIKAGPVELKFKEVRSGTSDVLSLADAEVIRMGPDFAYLSRFVPDAVRALIPPSWYVRSTVSQKATGELIFTVDR